MEFKETIVRKGKGYKMVYVKDLGNYRVYHSGNLYVFANKRDANSMVDAFRRVKSKRKKK